KFFDRQFLFFIIPDLINLSASPLIQPTGVLPKSRFFLPENIKNDHTHQNKAPNTIKNRRTRSIKTRIPLWGFSFYCLK
ncbi:MAG: hypothetical protein ACLFPX_06175, partial [Candidatus Omnitrophota bacterium]